MTTIYRPRVSDMEIDLLISALNKSVANPAPDLIVHEKEMLSSFLKKLRTVKAMSEARAIVDRMTESE